MGTVTVKTSELIGPALDWAVAKCEGLVPFSDGISWIVEVNGKYLQLPKYSTDWSQGGPIIERERTSIIEEPIGLWMGSIGGCTDLDMPLYQENGPTPLIAAMRCYVASKLGDTVEIPKELRSCISIGNTRKGVVYVDGEAIQ